MRRKGDDEIIQKNTYSSLEDTHIIQNRYSCLGARARDDLLL